MQKIFSKQCKKFIAATGKVLNDLKSKLFPTQNVGQIPTPEEKPSPKLFVTPKPLKNKPSLHLNCMIIMIIFFVNFINDETKCKYSNT